MTSHNWHDAANEIREEALAATLVYPPFHSAHEGWAVIKEELDELWEEVRKKQEQRHPVLMRHEAKQVAAMALRFMVELCHGDPVP